MNKVARERAKHKSHNGMGGGKIAGYSSQKVKAPKKRVKFGQSNRPKAAG